MVKIIKLIEREGGEIRATTLFLPVRNIVNRPINLLYPLETAPVSDEFNSDPLPSTNSTKREWCECQTSVRKIKAPNSKNCERQTERNIF